MKVVVTPIMNLFFITSECVPYASTGGLGDVASALPIALQDLGHHCTRVMPYYRQVWERGHEVESTGIHLGIPMGQQILTAEVLRSSIDKVETFFVKFDGFFDRPSLYNESFGDYHDNAWRFCFFQKAALALMDTLERNYDVVHANDWQTGLIPLMLKHGTDGNPGLGTPSIFTIHNLAYQGHFASHDFRLTGLPHFCNAIYGCEFWGGMNFMKAGIAHANKVTTVSDTYAKEIQTSTFGYGMENLLKHRSDDLHGLVNGIDMNVWNPESDPHLAAPFNAKDPSGKQACKLAVLKEMGLPEDPNTPLIGIVTRLASQKGIELIGHCILQIMQRDVRFVLLGSGDPEYERWIGDWQTTWPDKFSAHIGFDNGLSHRIEAGSDLYLMPSVYEPCGLNQMYSLRYGTIPIVTPTGGLYDTIKPQGAKEPGTGFVMRDHSAEALLEQLDLALDLYKQPRRWNPLVKRAMKEDFSWQAAAKKYLAIYKDA